MVETMFVLLGISFVLFFGFLAEFIFKKLYIPDILFLMLLGILIGPNVLGYLSGDQLSSAAPIFTTFALFFLVYNGAFNMDLESIAKGIKKGIGLTFYTMFLSIIVVTAIMYVATGDLSISILSGFILCGISSAFVIPIVEQLKVKKERRIRSNARYTIGVDFGGTYVKLALLCFSENTFKVEGFSSFETSNYARDELIEQLVIRIIKLKAESTYKGNRVRGVGIGVPGRVDFNKGIVCELTNVAGWKNVAVRRFRHRDRGCR